MSVDVTFGKNSYESVAGVLVQTGLHPQNGMVNGKHINLRLFVFLLQDSSIEMTASPELGLKKTLLVGNSGAEEIDISFPNIQFRGESVSFHNQSAIKCLEFRYDNINNTYAAKADIKMNPIIEASDEAGAQGTIQIPGGQESYIIGQQHRKFHNGATIVRIMNESQSGSKGWLSEMLTQNHQITSKSSELGCTLSFILNGKTIDHKTHKIDFVEYEERFGIANYCTLPTLSQLETATAPIFNFPEINEQFAGTTADFIASLSGVESQLKHDAGMGFIEVFTFKSKSKSARDLDLSPPAWS